MIGTRFRAAVAPDGYWMRRTAGGGKAGRGAAQTAASPLRKTIAERMTASLRSTAPVTLTTTVDASNVVNLRGQFKVAGGDIVPGYTDFLVKLAAAALQKHPCNGRELGPARAEIAPMRSLDIGIAVDADAGLFVPVIHDAPGLSIRQVAARSRDLAERARAGRLQSSEMQGGARSSPTSARSVWTLSRRSSTIRNAPSWAWAASNGGPSRPGIRF